LTTFQTITREYSSTHAVAA